MAQICFAANSPRAHNVRAQFLKTRHLCHNKSPCGDGNQNQSSIVYNRAANLLRKFAAARVACARVLKAGDRFQKQRGSKWTPFAFGAGDGNRTRVFGLGSGHSAIELHLHLPSQLFYHHSPKKSRESRQVFPHIFSKTIDKSRHT